MFNILFTLKKAPQLRQLPHKIYCTVQILESALTSLYIA